MRKYLFLTVSVLLLCGGICTVTLFNVDPLQAPATVILAFFIFFGLFITSLILSLYIMIGYKKNSYGPIGIAFRRATLVAIAISGTIAMSALNVLNPLSAVTFILAVFFLEMLLVGRAQESRLYKK